MPFKYSLLAVIISIGCAIDAGLPSVTLAQVPVAVSSEGKTLLKAARIEIKNKHYSEAIRMLEEAVAIFEADNNLKSKSISLKELGYCYFSLKQYPKAIDYYQQALNTARQISDIFGESSNLNNLGIISIKLEKYPEAIEYLQQALKIARQIGNLSIETKSLADLGTVSQKLGKYPEAIDYHQKALKINRQIGDLNAERKNLNNLGSISKKLERYPEAADYYQQALKIARQIGNLDVVIDSLINLGTVSRKLEKYSEAIDYYQQALKIARQIGNRSSESINLNNLGTVSQKLEKYPEAINYYQQALKINRQVGDRNSETTNLSNLGLVSRKLGKYPEAINYQQQALKIARQIGNLDIERNSLGNLGVISQELGKYPETINYYQQALKLNRQTGNRIGEGRNVDSLGSISQELGKYPEAINYYQQALKISRQIGDRDGETTTLSNLGSISKSLGKYPEAIGYYQQALKISRQIDNHYNEATSLFNLGIVSKSLGKYPEAIDYCQQALKISRQRGERIQESIILRFLGIVSESLGKYPEAIDYYQQALKIARQIGDRSSESDNLINLGIISKLSEKYPQAIDYYQQSLKISRQIGNRSNESVDLTNLGNVFKLLGKYPQAIDYYQQATNIQDSLRNGLKDEDKVSLFQRQVVSYRRLTSALLLNQDLPGSLIATERGRARAFSDLLARRLEANPTITKPNTLNFAQIQAQAISRQATIVSYSIFPDFNSKPLSGKPYKVLIHLIGPTGKLTVRESLISKDSDLSQLVDNNRTELLASRSGKKLTIDRLKPKMLVRLNGDEPDTRRQIVTVDPQKQTIVLQGIGQNARETEEVAFSDIAGIALPTERPELRQLHQLLIAPIADLLPTNPLAPVIFIPDSVLYEVPFAALKNERGQYLIDLHTISIAPSLSILAQTAQLKQRNIPRTSPSLVIGNPDFSKLKQRYEQLQFSGEEARGVSALFPSQLLLGDRATESAVKQSLPTARIAHFATHGIRDGDNGLNSGIILTPSGTDSGILTAEKVLDLKLNADLVVLSACDTGRGKITWDGVIGLSRSFITAGANSVIVSLWSVDDKATAMLMTDFYRQWQGGKSKAQALRAAMLNTKAQYPDPYYWSSMSLYGEID